MTAHTAGAGGGGGGGGGGAVQVFWSLRVAPVAAQAPPPERRCSASQLCQPLYPAGHPPATPTHCVSTIAVQLLDALRVAPV
ncbi:hypothetical protein AE925_11695 [Xanthomonas arboricola]|nr:hypothetical protein AE925_11695 [Xanthomonas arboricola]